MKVCVQCFGKPRQTDGGHAIFKTPWVGDPRINLEDDKGKAKPYQVRQVTSEAVPTLLAGKHYSGEFRGRIPAKVHRALALQAAEHRTSLNRLASMQLAA